MTVSSPASLPVQSGTWDSATASARGHYTQSRQKHYWRYEHPPGASPCSSSPPISGVTSFTQKSSATSPRASKRYARYFPSPADNTHHTPSWSKLILSRGLEELRSVLERYTISPDPAYSPQRPSGDRSRGTMAAEPGSLEGDGIATVRSNSVGTASTHSPLHATASTPATAAAAAATSSGSIPAKRQSSVVNDLTIAPNDLPAVISVERKGTQSKRPRPLEAAVKRLPQRYEFAHPNDLVVLISSMLMELLQYNDKIPLNEGRLTRFHSRTPPRISVQDYLQRLTTHATLSPPILLSMVYYIDRLCALYPAFTVSSLTVHRFLIASATVASKGLSDSFWTNRTYARVGGVSISELALLELEFLFRVEWKIVPQPEVLVDYYLSLVERCEGYELEPEDSHPQGTSTENSPPSSPK